MKHLLLVLVTLVAFNTAHAKNNKKKPAHKMSKADARELCLTSKGSQISDKELKKCVTKAMRKGRI